MNSTLPPRTSRTVTPLLKCLRAAAPSWMTGGAEFTRGLYNDGSHADWRDGRWLHERRLSQARLSPTVTGILCPQLAAQFRECRMGWARGSLKSLFRSMFTKGIPSMAMLANSLQEASWSLAGPKEWATREKAQSHASKRWRGYNLTSGSRANRRLFGQGRVADNSLGTGPKT